MNTKVFKEYEKVRVYGNNFVMDYILEQDILEYFNQNK